MVIPHPFFFIIADDVVDKLDDILNSVGKLSDIHKVIVGGELPPSFSISTSWRQGGRTHTGGLVLPRLYIQRIDFNSYSGGSMGSYGSAGKYTFYYKKDGDTAETSTTVSVNGSVVINANATARFEEYGYNGAGDSVGNYASMTFTIYGSAPID